MEIKSLKVTDHNNTKKDKMINHLIRWRENVTKCNVFSWQKLSFGSSEMMYQVCTAARQCGAFSLHLHWSSLETDHNTCYGASRLLGWLQSLTPPHLHLHKEGWGWAGQAMIDFHQPLWVPFQHHTQTLPHDSFPAWWLDCKWLC